MIFWVAHPGAPIYRRWVATGDWQCIGTLGTRTFYKADDVPDRGAFYLADNVLLKAPIDPSYPRLAWM